MKVSTPFGEFRVHKNQNELAFEFARFFQDLSASVIARKDVMNIALAGGNTPKTAYGVLSDFYRNKIEWNKIHFFWSDERCVTPDHPESNYLMAKVYLLDQLPIPEGNVHRVFGEQDPVAEAVRYGNLIQRLVPQVSGVPIFDLIMLGMGEDGHVASIFPDQISLFDHASLCAVAVHPSTGQRRITMTGKLLKNARNITIMATGKTKEGVLNDLLNNPDKGSLYPVSRLREGKGKITWFVDQEIFPASLLNTTH